MQLSIFQLFKHPGRQRFKHPEPSEILILPEKHLPAGSLEILADHLNGKKVLIRLAGQRFSKTGDYRPARNGRPATITVNSDLNAYSFLITLVHELAHHEVFSRYFRPQPHGELWKSEFRRLMTPFLKSNIFPEDIRAPLHKHLQSARASVSADPALASALHLYDADPGVTTLNLVPQETLFRTPNGRTFRKGTLLRKRFRCKCLETGKFYLISGSASVQILST